MLTAVQIKAISLIRLHGKLVRYKGGFWQKGNDPCEGRSAGTIFPLNWVATKTISCLISKNIFVVTKENEDRFTGEKYPVEVHLTEFGEVIYNQQKS